MQEKTRSASKYKTDFPGFDGGAKGTIAMDLFDLIGPVMVGPSSSHTAGAARIGLTARMLLGEDVVQAEIAFHGSFAKTYQGHGTDRALVGGLMGMQVDDLRLRESLTLAREAGIVISFQQVNIRGAHPNTVQMTITGRSGRQLMMEAASVGGGNIEIRRIDGMNVAFTGKENTLVIQNTDAPGAIAAVTGALAQMHINIASMQVYRRQAGADAMMVLELDGQLSDEDVKIIQNIRQVRGCTFLKRRNG